MAASYHKIEITGVSQEAFSDLRSEYKKLDSSDVDVAMLGYNPTTGVVSIVLGGSDLSKYVSSLRDTCEAVFGKAPSLDESADKDAGVTVKEDLQKEASGDSR